MDDLDAAPRWRSLLAGLLDMGLIGAVAWAGARGTGDAAAAASRLRYLRMVPAEALREQLRTPGQRLLGLRTVDRRTGERVALWRTLLLTAVAAVGQQVTQRLAPAPPTPEQEAERTRFFEQVRGVYERHPAGGPERDAEMQALHARQPDAPHAQLPRLLAPTLAAGLLAARLRRRLAPTLEVRSRR